MKFIIDYESGYTLIQNPHLVKNMRYKRLGDDFVTKNSDFALADVEQTAFLLDTASHEIQRLSVKTLVPTPKQQELNASKVSIRQLCAKFGSSTIQRAIQKSDKLRITQEGHQFETDQGAFQKSLINVTFPFRTDASDDLSVFPLEGLLCQDDAEFARAHCETLSRQYTGFTDEQVQQYASQQIAPKSISVKLQEENCFLAGDLQVDRDSPAFAVLINVLAAIHARKYQETLNQQLQDKFGGQFDEKKLKLYAVLLLLHLTKNHVGISELAKIIKMKEVPLKELLKTNKIQVKDEVAFLDCGKFTGYGENARKWKNSK